MNTRKLHLFPLNTAFCCYGIAESSEGKSCKTLKWCAAWTPSELNKPVTTLTPALVMLMVCCSMASWMATWSLMSILSNSSMQHTPYREKDGYQHCRGTCRRSSSSQNSRCQPALELRPRSRTRGTPRLWPQLPSDLQHCWPSRWCTPPWGWTPPHA